MEKETSPGRSSQGRNGMNILKEKEDSARAAKPLKRFGGPLSRFFTPLKRGLSGSLLLGAAGACLAQDGQGAPYTEGWYLGTNTPAQTMETDLSQLHGSSVNPVVPGNPSAVA